MNYYNEFDKDAAAWLRNLIAADLIPAGDVDERSIEDVKPNELRGYTQHHFFAGIGGWPLALDLAGWPRDRPVWTGSCPCQSFSAAGKGLGFADQRHLWPAWFHIIRELAPATVFGEQVAAAIRFGWLDLVSADLEGAGYAVVAAVLGAHSAGAPHIRQRLYFVAESNNAERRADVARRDERDRQATGRQQGDGDAGERGAVGLVAESASKRSVERRGFDLQRGRQINAEQAGVGGGFVMADTTGERCGEARRSGERSAQRDGERGPDGVAQGDAIDPRSQGHGRPVNIDDAQGRQDAGRHCATAGFWDNGEWRIGSDGKARIIESGIAPLVARLPGGMVPSSNIGMEIDADRSAEARVMRLRGYGNAICPQTAAAFIAAYMACARLQCRMR